MKRAVKIFKALSDETRLRILKMLEQRPLCVCEIQFILKGSQPNVSHHLKTLSEAGLLESSKNGLWVTYRIVGKPESLLHTAILALVRRSFKTDLTIRKDREIIRSVNRVELSLRKTM